MSLQYSVYSSVNPNLNSVWVPPSLALCNLAGGGSVSFRVTNRSESEFQSLDSLASATRPVWRGASPFPRIQPRRGRILAQRLAT